MITSTVDPVLANSSSIDWNGVRQVYQKLHQDFSILTEPFGIIITKSMNRDLAHLVCAIDVIDRVLDDIKNPSDRHEFSNAIVEFIGGIGMRLSLQSPSIELVTRLHRLRNIVVRHQVQAEFAHTAERIFFHTESKRTAQNAKVMIEHLNQEWRLSGRLTVLILGDLSNRRFENFFGLCCEAMTVVDMVGDAKQDFATGQLSFRPGLLLYIRLISSFLFRLPGLLWRFPRKLMLIRYAASFIWQARP